MSERASVLAIGPGFSGVGMAIRLKRSGVEDFAFLECDSRCRSCFSASQPEKYGILPHIRHGANVVASRFDEASSTWVVSADGRRAFRGHGQVSSSTTTLSPPVPGWAITSSKPSKRDIHP